MASKQTSGSIAKVASGSTGLGKGKESDASSSVKSGPSILESEINGLTDSLRVSGGSSAHTP